MSSQGSRKIGRLGNQKFGKFVILGEWSLVVNPSATKGDQAMASKPTAAELAKAWKDGHETQNRTGAARGLAPLLAAAAYETPEEVRAFEKGLEDHRSAATRAWERAGS